MKNILSIFVLVLIFGCKASKNDSRTITITSTQVQETVSYLASDSIKGRETGSEGIEKCATMIENKFKEFGINSYYDTYRDNFKVEDLDAFNVIGFIEGNDPKLKNEVIILSAHYDHIGNRAKTVDNDSIANGANDNAAGTSAVIALANYFAAKKNNKRSIMFALFSAEERGLLGSKHLAERLKAEEINLYAMVNFEMIGVPMKDKDYVAYLTGYDLSNMAEKMNEYTNSNLLGLLPKAKEFNLFKRSDNHPFYKEFNLPSQTISTFDFTNYEYYHHVDDEAEKIDYEHMADLINKIIPAIETMSNTPTMEIKMNE